MFRERVDENFFPLEPSRSGPKRFRQEGEKEKRRVNFTLLFSLFDIFDYKEKLFV